MGERIPPDIASRAFDLVVVGGGINGAGIARDAAMRGLRVLLLEKADIASGTTSWSTRLIHGGLRYLEYAEVELVRESLLERERLLRSAPHLVRPLPMVIPIYDQDKRGPLLVRLGMLAYDALSFDKSLPRHRMLGHDEVLRRAEGLNPAGLRGAAVYYDAQVEYAERLAVENMLSARNHGAVVLTYARVDRLLIEGDRAVGVAFTDLLGGGSTTARAAVTVNVAGPWVDKVLTGSTGSNRLMGGTKGSHIVVHPFPGAPREALYVEAGADHRPFFILPWNDLYLIGTTDKRYTGDLDRVVADEDEIAYLLGETNRVIPQAALGRESVLFTYSGVRPLPHSEEGAEGSITRRHIVKDHAPGLQGVISIVGGKLTTYRALAEQAVDAALWKLGRRPPRSHTAKMPLPGGGPQYPAFAEAFRHESRLPPASTEHLLRVYGTRAAEVLRLAGRDRALLEPLALDTPTIGAEVLLAFQREGAETLGDALSRRTMAGLGASVGVGADEAAARIACERLGWDDARASRELAAYREYVTRFTPRALDTRPIGV